MFRKCYLIPLGFLLLCALFLVLSKDAYLLLPPIVAIGLAFWTKNVLFSIFMGTFVGSVVSLGAFKFENIFKGFLRVGDHYLVEAVADSGRAGLILFTMTIGGMVALVTQSGGLNKLLSSMIGFANTTVKAQLLMFGTGLLVFFDDYANTIIVGNLYRSLSDKYKISREKFSFIIDSTAAPVASLSIVSTWVAYEIGLINAAVEKLGIEQDGFDLFISSLPHRYYAIFMLFFIVMTIVMRRDWGPMHNAELRARKTGDVYRPDSKPMMAKEVEDWQLKVKSNGTAAMGWLPILVLLMVVLVGFWISGKSSLVGDNKFNAQTTLRDILGASDAIVVLIWGALVSTAVAMVMTVWGKVFSFDESFEVWLEGVKSMVLPIVILVFAWGLSAVMDELKSGEVLSHVLEGKVYVHLVPALIFLMSFLMAFATGTSWGTMAILFPLAIPLAHGLMVAQGLDPDISLTILSATVGSILTGSIFGDHISPISDTTIMSSIWAGIDHMDHVQSQMPYALFIGGVSTVVGYLPAGFGISPWITLPIGLAVMFVVLKWKGKQIPLN